jgi:hypothetical protein
MSWGAKQELHQKVCQRYGWSTDFSRDDQGRWKCTVCTGLNGWRTYVSDCTAENIKEGQEAASQVTLDGLKDEISKQEAKSTNELIEVFPDPISVYESNTENWSYFWQHRPAVVGIDTEGNQVSPPVLVQIACDDYTILETPQQGRLSPDLSRLLSDKSIIKVFCDNKAHRDKRCLGLSIPDDLTAGDVVDLEVIANKLLGEAKSPRGLSRLVTLTMPELNVRIEKPKPKEFYGKEGRKGRWHSIGRFSLIEQGKAPPLQSVSDLSRHEQQYAALDAWCTLQVYGRFIKARPSR